MFSVVVDDDDDDDDADDADDADDTDDDEDEDEDEDEEDDDRWPPFSVSILFIGCRLPIIMLIH